MISPKAMIPAGGLAFLLAGCALPGTPAENSHTAGGACIAHDTTPAVIETVTEDILRRPAELGPDGSITRPAVFETISRQRIVQERREARFETPCPPVFDTDFIASLQRALKARHFYKGPVSGDMDEKTRQAIRAYQRENGLNSAILSSASARRLGLLVTPLN